MPEYRPKGMPKKAQTVQGIKVLKADYFLPLLPLHYTPNAPDGVRQYPVGRICSVLHSFLHPPQFRFQKKKIKNI